MCQIYAIVASVYYLSEQLQLFHQIRENLSCQTNKIHPVASQRDGRWELDFIMVVIATSEVQA